MLLNIDIVILDWKVFINIHFYQIKVDKIAYQLQNLANLKHFSHIHVYMQML